jgi:hypothetical protein
LFEGGIDLVIWGKPFVEIYQYVLGCFTERNDYITLPWYNYFLVIGGMLIPPVSIFLFWGFMRKWKKYFMIFLPVLLFFAFHSYYSNDPGIHYYWQHRMAGVQGKINLLGKAHEPAAQMLDIFLAAELNCTACLHLHLFEKAYG